MTLKPEPQWVMAPEIAKTLRQALIGVVMEGTATRLRGTCHAPDGTLLPVGGKTGTGDNRLDRFGRGGRLISQRVVDRTATFVFFLGDRFFGTITAYVPGTIAGTYVYCWLFKSHNMHKRNRRIRIRYPPMRVSSGARESRRARPGSPPAAP
jgi:hypothetical protein